MNVQYPISPAKAGSRLIFSAVAESRLVLNDGQENHWRDNDQLDIGYWGLRFNWDLVVIGNYWDLNKDIVLN